MEEKVALQDALKAAAEQHSWDSQWTRDGETARTLTDWWNEAQTPTAPPENLFLFDGTRIIRQGADIQDYQAVLYLAEERCDYCQVYLQLDAKQREDRAESVVKARLCFNCMSGGALGRVFGRNRRNAGVERIR
jgi:hypothetical protein